MQNRTVTILFSTVGLIVLLFFGFLWRNPYTRSILTGKPVAVLLAASSTAADAANLEDAIAEPTAAAIEQQSQAVTPSLASVQENYCLLPDETLWDISQRSNTTVDALNAANPKFTGFAGSALHLPAGSLPPNAWTSSESEFTDMGALPFGVSGYFLGHDNRRKRISLTFDIGYVPENLKLMQLLADRGISATFFVIGTAMKNKPEVVVDVLNYGHELANHSWTHDYMQSMDEKEILNELRWTEEAVKAAHPEASTKPFFRAPFGAITPEMVNIVKGEGYYTIGWTIDSGDWVPGITPDEIYTRVIDSICPGAILVMHDANLPSFAALPHILDTLQAMDYEVVPLSTLLFP